MSRPATPPATAATRRRSWGRTDGKVRRRNAARHAAAEVLKDACVLVRWEGVYIVFIHGGGCSWISGRRTSKGHSLKSSMQVIALVYYVVTGAMIIPQIALGWFKQRNLGDMSRVGRTGISRSPVDGSHPTPISRRLRESHFLAAPAGAADRSNAVKHMGG